MRKLEHGHIVRIFRAAILAFQFSARWPSCPASTAGARTFCSMLKRNARPYATASLMHESPLRAYRLY